MLGVSNN